MHLRRSLIVALLLVSLALVVVLLFAGQCSATRRVADPGESLRSGGEVYADIGEDVRDDVAAGAERVPFVGDGIVVLDESGQGVHGAGLWGLDGVVRVLEEGGALSVADEHGRVVLTHEMRESVGGGDVCIAARGYSSLMCGPLTGIAPGSVFTLRARSRTRFVVTHNGIPLPQVDVVASESEMSDADMRVEVGVLPGLPEESAVYMHKKDIDGVALVPLREGVTYWVCVRKFGYIASQGDPMRIVGGRGDYGVDMVALGCIRADIDGDEILSVRTQGLMVMPQCAAYMQSLAQGLAGADQRRSLCYVGMIDGEGDPGLVDVSLYLARQGRFVQRLHVQKIANGVVPEVVHFQDGRVRETSEVTFRLSGDVEFGGVYDQLSVTLTPRGGVDNYSVRLGAPMRLPHGVYELGSWLSVVRDNMVRETGLVEVGGVSSEHVIKLKDPLRPVQFRIASDAGVLVRRAEVYAKRLDDASGATDQKIVSQGAVNLPDMVVWLTDGVWEVRVTPVGGKELRTVLDFPRDWRVGPEARGVLVIDDLR